MYRIRILITYMYLSWDIVFLKDQRNVRWTAKTKNFLFFFIKGTNSKVYHVGFQNNISVYIEHSLIYLKRN